MTANAQRMDNAREAMLVALRDAKPADVLGYGRRQFPHVGGLLDRVVIAEGIGGDPQAQASKAQAALDVLAWSEWFHAYAQRLAEAFNPRG